MRGGLFKLCICLCVCASQFLYATDRYVSSVGLDQYPYTNWAMAAQVLQSAIDASDDGDTVYVAPGIYDTGGVVSASGAQKSRVAITRDIHVRSTHGADVTYIVGDDNPQMPTRGAYMTAGALTGFTVSNGHAIATSQMAEDTCGGGIYMDGAACVVAQCCIVENSAIYNGGGVYVEEGGKITDNVITDNHARYDGGGVYISCYATATVHWCMIADNHAGLTSGIGGGIVGGRVFDTIICGNVIQGDGGGAAQAILERCRIYDNVAMIYGGGVAYSRAYNSVIYANTAEAGGGGAFASLLVNCTVSDNAVEDIGAMAHVRPAAVSAMGGGVYACVVTNGIVYYNEPDNVEWESLFVASCVYPEVTGTQNITNVPVFLGEGYHLSNASPCRDAGMNQAVHGMYDAEGHPRIMNDVVDMGAYEYSSAPSYAFFSSADAITGEEGSAQANNTYALTEMGEPGHAGNEGPYHSVWWQWQFPGNGHVLFSSARSAFPSVIGAYTGSTMRTLVSVGSDGSIEALRHRSSPWQYADVRMREGAYVYIAVDGESEDDVGDVILDWQFSAAPTNDDFADAYFLSGDHGMHTVTNTSATTEAGEPEHALNGGPYRSVWYAWTSLESGTLILRTEGSVYDTVLAVYTGATVDVIQEIVSNDDEEIDLHEWSHVRLHATADVTYYIAIDGAADEEHGHTVLSWLFVEDGVTPINDDFANAIELVGLSGQVGGHNIGATAEVGEPEHAHNMGPYHSVWWRWTAPSDGELTVWTEGSAFDTVLALYFGTAVHALFEVASNDDEEGGATWSKVTTPVAAGMTYHIAVDGAFDEENGLIRLSWYFQADGDTRPVITHFSLNEGEATTTNRNIMTRNEATFFPTEYMMSQSPSFIGAAWHPYAEHIPYTLTPQAGNKTVYLKVRNAAGESAPVNAEIQLLRAPQIVTYTINSGAAVTTSRYVQLHNTCLYAPSEYRASENSTFSGAVWEPYATAPSFLVSPAPGEKTVYIQTRNAAGMSAVAQDTIQYVVPPELVDVSLNGGALDTTTRLVTVHMTTHYAPTHYMASEDPLFSAAEWQEYAETVLFYLTSEGYGDKTVYVKARNAAGESSIIADNIYLEEVVSLVQSGFFMRVAEPVVRVGDTFHVELYSQIASPWDYICQHIRRDTASQAQFSFTQIFPSGIVPTEFYTTQLGADKRTARTEVTNTAEHIDNGVIARVACRAESAGHASISYIAHPGPVLFRTETCALTNGLDVLMAPDNHLDGMTPLSFRIHPQIAGVQLRLESEYHQYETGDIVRVSVHLTNTQTAHYNTVSLLLEYTTNVLTFLEAFPLALSPDIFEVYVAPNGYSNMLALVAHWDDTHALEGPVMMAHFFAQNSGRARIIPQAPDAAMPSPAFGTTVMKNWVDVMASPHTWVHDMPSRIAFNVYPFKPFTLIADIPSPIVDVEEKVDVQIRGRAPLGAPAEYIGIALAHTQPQLAFDSLQPNYAVLTNVTWQDEGTYVWLSAKVIDKEANVDGTVFATFTYRTEALGTARVGYYFLTPPEAFEEGSTYGLWNGVDVLGSPTVHDDGVIGAQLLVVGSMDDIQSLLSIQGEDSVPHNGMYTAYIVCETNKVIDPSVMSVEMAWENDVFHYRGHELVAPHAASFISVVTSNNGDGLLRIWSDGITVADCVSTVAVVRFYVAEESDTELSLLAPYESDTGGTYIHDIQGADLLGTSYDPDDGMFDKEIIVTEEEGYYLEFRAAMTHINPGDYFSFDILLTNYTAMHVYDTIAFLCEYDADEVVDVQMISTALAGASVTHMTNFGDYFGMAFTWPSPTNMCGVLATISAVTYGDSDLEFAFVFGDELGVFPGTYALDNGFDVLGSTEDEYDGIGDELEFENTGLPVGASLHFIGPDEVHVGDTFDAYIYLSNSANVRVSAINILFAVEKDGLEVETVTQGECGGTVTRAHINHMTGTVQYREEFPVPTLVSGIVCRLTLFARGASDSGYIDFIEPSSEFDDDGTFVRNAFFDLLSEDDGGADMEITIPILPRDYPVLYLDDYNDVDLFSGGSLIACDLSDYILGRNVEEETLITTIEQVSGPPATQAFVLPLPPYPLMIYSDMHTVGTQLFKVTVRDHLNPHMYSYDYIGLVLDEDSEYVYPHATGDNPITTAPPEYIYRSRAGGVCTFVTGVFHITQGDVRDRLIVRTPGNYAAVISDSGLRRLVMQGSLNTLNVQGPLGVVRIKDGNIGDVTAAEIRGISVTAPRHFVRDYDTFDDTLEDPQGLVGIVQSEGDIRTIIVRSGDVGALDDNGDYGTHIISKNGDIGRVMSRMRVRRYGRGDDREILSGGGNIYANIHAPGGALGRVMAQNNMGWENTDNPAMITSRDGMRAVALRWRKIREGDAPTFYASVITAGELRQLSVKGASLGTDDRQTVIYANQIRTVRCMLTRDAFFDFGDILVDVYGGNLSAHIISETGIRAVRGAGDVFESYVIAGGDIGRVAYRGYRDEGLWGGEISDAAIAAGLTLNSERQTGSIRSVSAQDGIYDTVILAGCLFADQVPQYKGTIRTIRTRGRMDGLVIGTREPPKVVARDGMTNIRYFINGTPQ